MNNHLMSPGKLLDAKGNLREPGYAFELNTTSMVILACW